MHWLHAVLRLTQGVFLGLLLLATGGCGLVLVKQPPIGYQSMEHFTCTESNLGPILDMTAAVGGLVVVAVSQDDYYYYVQGAMIAIGLSTTALYGVSATFGFLKTKKCRAAKSQPRTLPGTDSS